MGCLSLDLKDEESEARKENYYFRSDEVGGNVHTEYRAKSEYHLCSR